MIETGVRSSCDTLATKSLRASSSLFFGSLGWGRAVGQFLLPRERLSLQARVIPPKKRITSKPTAHNGNSITTHWVFRLGDIPHHEWSQSPSRNFQSFFERGGCGHPQYAFPHRYRTSIPPEASCPGSVLGPFFLENSVED